MGRKNCLPKQHLRNIRPWALRCMMQESASGAASSQGIDAAMATIVSSVTTIMRSVLVGNVIAKVVKISQLLTLMTLMIALKMPQGTLVLRSSCLPHPKVLQVIPPLEVGLTLQRGQRCLCSHAWAPFRLTRSRIPQQSRFTREHFGMTIERQRNANVGQMMVETT